MGKIIQAEVVNLHLAETEFNTSVIVMITYKFIGGVLHGMHDRSHLAMVDFT